LPNNWNDFDVLYVTAFDNTNRELFTWSWPISSPKKIADKLVIIKGEASPKTVETATHHHRFGIGCNSGFRQKNGLLTSAQNSKGTVPLNNGPILCDGTAIPT
jgi:hypothetical protein